MNQTLGSPQWSLRDVVVVGIAMVWMAFATALGVVASYYFIDPSLYTDFMAEVRAPLIEISALDIFLVLGIGAVIYTVMVFMARGRWS